MDFASNETLDELIPGGGGGSIGARRHNGTLSGEALSLAATIIFSGIFALIAAVGMIGNSLVIVAIAGDSKMRKSTMNALLLNLAVADVCNLIACIPEFVFQLVDRGWLMPNFFCPLLRFLERVFLYTSLLTQLAVGIERFYAIMYPMKVHILCSRRKVILWSFLLWSAAMAFSSPYAVWTGIQVYPTGELICKWGMGLSPNTRFTLQLSECFIFYFAPLVLIVVLYSVVAAKLWSRDEQLHEGRSDSGPSETLKTRKSVVKMLIVCVCVYFICYSPIQAIFISELLASRRVRFGMSATIALHCLVYSCSAANPIVYTVYSIRFRRKFAQLLRCNRPYERVSAAATSNLAMASNQLTALYTKNNGPLDAASPARDFAQELRAPNGDASASCDSELLVSNPRTKLLSGPTPGNYSTAFGSGKL